ncbi:HvfC/BufC N-terminal domain-containing protein [Paraburkholderia acidisoli]|uniref:DUF2063 domain-containing protein n=1 Tax=Paraburkholderia acidisoli TaxID=2571748 RepID=A0A7Z2GEV5_9BURK|nr:DNA-binding domain-containing protein [Paraburkholderia acidisoli]QGZ60373.1 DUF2063 domain-containing protein [Paraburkholderia acidisoli]
MSAARDSLAQAQHAFAAALDDAAADAALAPTLLPADPALLHARLGLYRGNVRAARRHALASAYPVLAALTGDAYFDALALAYARAHPPQDADLTGFGASLAAFVAHYESEPRYAYFADVARLEWALHVAAYAANVTPWSAAHWQTVDAGRLAQARLRVHPACAALALRADAPAIWRAHQPGGAWPERIDTPAWTLVVRPQWRPALLTHTPAAHAAFIALSAGTSLDEALALAFDVDAAFDFGGTWRAWIEAGAIVDMSET